MPLMNWLCSTVFCPSFTCCSLFNSDKKWASSESPAIVTLETILFCVLTIPIIINSVGTCRRLLLNMDD